MAHFNVRPQAVSDRYNVNYVKASPIIRKSCISREVDIWLEQSFPAIIRWIKRILINLSIYSLIRWADFRYRIGEPTIWRQSTIETARFCHRRGQEQKDSKFLEQEGSRSIEKKETAQRL